MRFFRFLDVAAAQLRFAEIEITDGVLVVDFNRPFKLFDGAAVIVQLALCDAEFADGEQPIFAKLVCLLERRRRRLIFAQIV